MNLGDEEISKFLETAEKGRIYLTEIVRLISDFIPEDLKEKVYKEVDFKKQLKLIKKKKKVVACDKDTKLAYEIGKENGILGTILVLLFPKKKLLEEGK